MNLLPKFTWLIDEIRRAGRISLEDLSDRWERAKDLSDCKPLSRATFDRWRNAIREQFCIDIVCQKSGGYLYYIANPEEIDDNKLEKWMLDSYSLGNIIRDNLGLKGRIIVDEIPSGREHLTTMLEAMKNNKELEIEYSPYDKSRSYTFPIEPYCIKFFENRWYVVAHNIHYVDIRIYALDRIKSAAHTGKKFKMPNDFDAEAYFSTAYGIVLDKRVKVERVVLRANRDHKFYLQSLPLHHSQRLIEDCGEYADFELYLSPTYDFVMRLLHVGAMVEVLKPESLRNQMRGWIRDMYLLYNEEETNDRLCRN